MKDLFGEGAPPGNEVTSSGQADGLVPRGLLRMLMGEYSLLRDISAAPMAAGPLAPSVADAVDFLRSHELVLVDEQQVSVTDRGRQLLEATPISSTKYTLAFDRKRLGW
ncbi:hypothetical protein [Planctomyces sp. SH-PL14]|uniref:hypothetical protein n=1 Tax=Planctomyces sp. SH-PL14 TaxID=1632864 RepID=UPI00094659A7|nr:hypothetical protein [Planctomyces sp. SH-PL14]